MPLWLANKLHPTFSLDELVKKIKNKRSTLVRLQISQEFKEMKFNLCLSLMEKLLLIATSQATLNSSDRCKMILKGKVRSEVTQALSRGRDRRQLSIMLSILVVIQLFLKSLNMINKFKENQLFLPWIWKSQPQWNLIPGHLKLLLLWKQMWFLKIIITKTNLYKVIHSKRRIWRADSPQSQMF